MSYGCCRNVLEALVTFHAALRVCNQAVQAYTDMMNTQT
jgi:flagellar hook-basal body complex protein FliE